MEVLTDSDSPILISNAEVMEMLNKRISKRKEKEAKQKRRRKHNKLAHRDWIEEKVHDYLQTTPCVNIDTSNLEELKAKFVASKKLAAGQSTSKTTGFNLTEAESLQLLNFLPQEPVEIHLMVEELHARMSEKRQEELLELIGSYTKDGNDTKAQGELAADASMEVLKEESLSIVKQEM